MRIGVSACILGKNYRYDGKSKPIEQLIKLLEGHEIVEVCPEVFGGLSIPRKPTERQGDKWLTKDGDDYTSNYLNGSLKCLELVKECDFVITKSKSPACGKDRIYDGTFSKTLTDGDGAFVELLKKHKIKVYSSDQIDLIRFHLIHHCPQ